MTLNTVEARHATARNELDARQRTEMQQDRRATHRDFMRENRRTTRRIDDRAQYQACGNWIAARPSVEGEQCGYRRARPLRERIELDATIAAAEDDRTYVHGLGLAGTDVARRSQLETDRRGRRRKKAAADNAYRAKEKERDRAIEMNGKALEAVGQNIEALGKRVSLLKGQFGQPHGLRA